MDYTNYIIIAIIVLLLILLIILLFKKNNNQSDYKFIEKDLTNKIEKLLRDNKESINDKILNFEKSINKEQSEFRNINLKESSELKLNIQKLNSENIEKIDKVTNEFLKLQTTIISTINNELEKINKKVEDRLSEGFKKTNETFLDVMKRLSIIDETQKKIEGLTVNIGSLQEVLTDKKTRGNFGEVQLEIILNSAFGENQSKIYEIQKTLSNKLVCDAFIKLPNDELGMAIDSKFPLENYKKMVDSNSDELIKKEATRLFKSDIKKHIDDISSKYIIEGETASQAIMFLPAEAIFAEINAYHQDLIEYSNKYNVVLTSPTTLMALFKVIIVVNRDSEMAKHSKVLQGQLRELGDEFKRYSKRWDSLQTHISQVTKDVSDINTTTNKINNKFSKISNATIEVEDVTLLEN